MPSANVGELSVNIEGDRSGLERELSQAERGLQKAQRQFGKIGRRMSAAVTAPLAAVGAKAIQTAGEFEQMRSRAEQVFDDQIAMVNRWADEFSEATGRGETRLLDFAAELQNVFVGFGFAREEAADLSTEFAELAVDIASFENIPAEQAIQKLTSAMAGQSQAVREWGADIRKTNIDQRLLNEGIVETVEEATEQQRVLARLNEVMESTADAHGNAADTSEEFKNSIQGTREQYEEMLADIGEQLLPLANQFLGVAEDWAVAFQELDDDTQELVVTLGLLTAAVGPLALSLNALIGVIFRLKAAKAGLTAALLGPKGLVAAIGALTTAGLISWANSAETEMRSAEDSFDEANESIEAFQESVDDLGRQSLEGLAADIQEDLDAVNEAIQEAEAELQAAQMAPGVQDERQAQERIAELLQDRARLKAQLSAIQEQLQSQQEEQRDRQERINSIMQTSVDLTSRMVGDFQRMDSMEVSPDIQMEGLGLPEEPADFMDFGDVAELQVSADTLERMAERSRAFAENASDPQIAQQAREQAETFERVAQMRREANIAERQLQGSFELTRIAVGEFRGALQTALATGEDMSDALTNSLENMVAQLVAATAQALALEAAMAAIGGDPGFDQVGGLVGAIGGILGFAEGGIVAQPTMALVGEGPEPEVIAPQSDFQDFAGAMLARTPDGQGRGAQSVTVELGADARRMAFEVSKIIDDRQK